MSSVSPTSNSAVRSDGIDYLRGMLILLVIVGHVVVGSLHDNWIRYPIHAFHMPLFIGITGYLLNANTLRDTSLFNVGIRYWWRMILPFSLAFIFFTGILFFHAYQENRITFGLLLSYLHTPYYHLWFIPTMMIWVLAYRFMLKTPIPLLAILLLFAFISLYWGSVPREEQISQLVPFLNKKVVYFFSFFLFGAWLRTINLETVLGFVNKFRNYLFVALVISSFFYLKHIGFEPKTIRGIAWLVLNMTLMLLLLPQMKSFAFRETKINQAIVAMGRNSLPIYLWHVAPLFLLKGFDVHQNAIALYYICSVVASILLVWLILRYEGRNRICDRLIYGA